MFGNILWVGAAAVAGYVAWRWRQRQVKDAAPPTYIAPAPVVTPTPLPVAPETPEAPVPLPPTPEPSTVPSGPRRVQTRIHRGPPPAAALRTEVPAAEVVSSEAPAAEVVSSEAPAAEAVSTEAPAAEVVSTEAPAAETVSLVNINSADEVALVGLPGIGPVLASRIVAYRQQHGPFRSVEQLDDVQGISLRNIDEFRHLVTV